MQELEKILEEIDNLYVDETDFGIECNMENRSDIACDNCYKCIKEACKNIIRKHMNTGWIPVKEQLPEEKLNKVSYQVTVNFGFGTDVRILNFKDGHWWCGPEILDQYVIAWRPFPEPHQEGRVD